MLGFTLCQFYNIKMDFKSVFLFLFFTICLHNVNSNIFIAGVSSSSSILEQCTFVCEQSFVLETNKVARSECCSRGCRFYGIAALVAAGKDPQLNISKESCHNCCYESYSDSNDKEACIMGCDSMAKHQREIIRITAAEVALASIIQEREGPLLFQPGDLMDTDDFLTDFALKQHLEIDLLNDGAKLPEMRVKTLPVNSDENAMVDGEWWSDCSVRRVGIPRCLAASMLVLLILIALWFGLSCDDKSTLPSPPIIYNSEQAPPLPPKYSLFDNVKA